MWLFKIDFISDTIVPDQDEFVPLPDLEEKSDDYYCGADTTLIDDQDNDHISISSEENLVKDESPFYANPLEDPEIQKLQYDFLYGDDWQ